MMRRKTMETFSALALGVAWAALLPAAGCGPAPQGKGDLYSQVEAMGETASEEGLTLEELRLAEAEVASAGSAPGELELALWNSPVFRRRFIESYAANTDLEPSLTDWEKEQMQKILPLMAEGQLDDAAKLVQRNRGAASSAAFDFTLGNIHFEREELEQAAEAYNLAVAKKANYRRAWLNLGLTYARGKQLPKAVAPLTRVISLGGGDALTYGLLGFAYSSVGNNLAAESAYRMAILLDPDTPDWTLGLAGSLLKQGRFADVAALCNHLISQEPHRSELWLLQANAYVGLGQATKAAENLELIDRLGASTVESLNTLADIYVNEELYDTAVDRYVAALDKDPQHRCDRALRAAKVLAGREARADAMRLIEHIESACGEALTDSTRKDILKLRARIAVAEGGQEEEARVLEQIVRLDPLDGDALILLGQHHSREGDDARAILYFERAAGIAECEADAKVRHAQLLARQGKYAEALPLLRRAQAVQPRDNVQEYLEHLERVAKAR